jgi:hypothetical protein
MRDEVVDGLNRLIFVVDRAEDLLDNVITEFMVDQALDVLVASLHEFAPLFLVCGDETLLHYLAAVFVSRKHFKVLQGYLVDLLLPLHLAQQSQRLLNDMVPPHVHHHLERPVSFVQRFSQQLTYRSVLFYRLLPFDALVHEAL